MAKFSRFDTRNKKKNRNKQMSKEKDFRIKRVLKKNGLHLRKTMVEYSYKVKEDL